MSGRPQRAHAPPASSAETTITDADLHRLFDANDPIDLRCVRLVGWLKVQARGELVLHAYDRTVRAELGWSETTLKRVKRRLREAGMGVDVKRHRETGEALVAVYVLDRRTISGVQQRPQVGPRLAPPIGTSENPPPLTTASLGSERRRRAPPRASPASLERAGDGTTENESVVETPAEPVRAEPTAAQLALVAEYRELADTNGGSEGMAARRLLHLGRCSFFELRAALIVGEGGGSP